MHMPFGAEAASEDKNQWIRRVFQLSSEKLTPWCQMLALQATGSDNERTRDKSNKGGSERSIGQIFYSVVLDPGPYDRRFCLKQSTPGKFAWILFMSPLRVSPLFSKHEGSVLSPLTVLQITLISKRSYCIDRSTMDLY
ncbi:unnamed protein product [Haemonchus placei]|uniref:PH domain-containing protein n=1 Tax=Haemonchus placei TaxID=6290 RepID=A0A158QN33_HAEPC|nr:unnamed protein product [Haemonchus placei]